MDLRVYTPTSDVILEVENTNLFVSKEILSSCSHVFKKMFQSGMIESNSNKISLPGKKLDEFMEFLGFFYLIERKITLDNVASLLELSDEYEFLSLSEKCEEFLLSCQNFDVETYVLAKRFRLPRLLRRCSIKIGEDLDRFSTDEEICDLDLQQMNEILDNSDLNGRYDSQFQALLTWLHNRGEGWKDFELFYELAKKLENKMLSPSELMRIILWVANCEIEKKKSEEDSNERKKGCNPWVLISTLGELFCKNIEAQEDALNAKSQENKNLKLLLDDYKYRIDLSEQHLKNLQNRYSIKEYTLHQAKLNLKKLEKELYSLNP